MRAGNGGTYGGREEKDPDPHGRDGDHVVSVGEHKPKQTFGAMPVKDYVAAVADPDGLPQAGQCRRGRVGAGGGDGVAGRARAALG